MLIADASSVVSLQFADNGNPQIISFQSKSLPDPEVEKRHPKTEKKSLALV